MQEPGENEGYAKITFRAGDGTDVEFCVLEQTKFYGINYLLVMEDTDSEEAEAYILKDLSDAGSEEAIYEMVEDEEELSALAKLFEDLMDDVEIMKE